MSRVVFGGVNHPAVWRKEIIRRLDDLLPDLVEVLKETEMFRLQLQVCVDGRVELRIEDARCRSELRDSADTHQDNRIHLDHERIFG